MRKNEKGVFMQGHLVGFFFGISEGYWQDRSLLGEPRDCGTDNCKGTCLAVMFSVLWLLGSSDLEKSLSVSFI